MTDRNALQARLDRKLLAARLALFWEDFWPRTAPALAVAGLYATLSLVDLWRFVDWTLHVALLAATGLLLVAALAWRLRGLRWPTLDAARRRLEIRSGTSHRPLQTLDDRLPQEAADPTAQALWAVHRRRAAAALARLKVGAPEAGIARRDRWGLRTAVALPLVVGLAVAGPEIPQRLADGLTPDIGGEGRAVIAIDAWLGPPAYTGLPPQFLSRDGKPVDTAAEPMRTPTGSTLLARVHGSKVAPTLFVDGRPVPFAPLDGQSWQVSTTLKDGQHLAIRTKRRDVADWRVAVTPDRVPDVAFVSPPAAGARATLDLAYKATDDYGLRRVAAEIRRNGSSEVLSVDLPLNMDKARESEEASSHDLTAHIWAGEAVQLRLVAEDALGQVGTTEVVEFVLPAREFRHPLAKAVVEQRKRLATDAATRASVARLAGIFAITPETYGGDTTVLLGLRTARTRLTAEPTDAIRQETVALMWDVALRIEQGNMTDAERALAEAQKRLQEALDRNAPDQEIERLAQELKRALDRYMQALAEQAERNGEEMSEVDEDAAMMTSEDLQRMIDRAREMARRGQRDEAKQMLSELQKLLESLQQNGRVTRQNPDRQRQRQQRAERGRQGQQQMQELNEMMRRQQELMDRSFRQNRERQQQGQQGQQGQRQQRGQQQQQQGDQFGAADQEALRQRMREMLRRLQEGMGQQPGQLGEAERQMGQAGQALRDGEPGQATGPQGQALDLMRQGAQQLAQQMGNQFGQGFDGDPQGDRTDQAEVRSEDPLGRDWNREYDDGMSTKVPTEMDAQRSREILEELYRRSGDRRRPQLERDYIDRLLRRF